MCFLIHIEAPDKQTADSVWSIQSAGVELEQPFGKGGLTEQFHEITAYIKDVTVLITFLGLLFKLLKPKKHSGPTQPAIHVHLHKTDVQVIQFIEENKGEVNVHIHTENNEGHTKRNGQ